MTVLKKISKSKVFEIFFGLKERKKERKKKRTALSSLFKTTML